MSTPIQLAITNDLIIYRDCWFKKNKTSEIKKITFAEGGDKITVHFTDGLDNIELLIKEYEFNELISCIKYLTSNPENKFEVSDILINYYFQKNN